MWRCHWLYLPEWCCSNIKRLFTFWIFVHTILLYPVYTLLNWTNCPKRSFRTLPSPLADIMWRHSQFSRSQLEKHIVMSRYVGKRSCQSKEGPLVAVWNWMAPRGYLALGRASLSMETKHVCIYLALWIEKQSFMWKWRQLSNTKMLVLISPHTINGIKLYIFYQLLAIFNCFNFVPIQL